MLEAWPAGRLSVRHSCWSSNTLAALGGRADILVGENKSCAEWAVRCDDASEFLFVGGCALKRVRAESWAAQTLPRPLPQSRRRPAVCVCVINLSRSRSSAFGIVFIDSESSHGTHTIAFWTLRRSHFPSTCQNGRATERRIPVRNQGRVNGVFNPASSGGSAGPAGRPCLRPVGCFVASQQRRG